MRNARFGFLTALAIMAAQQLVLAEERAAREIAKSPDRLETTVVRPKNFGTQDYNVTVIPAIAFLPESGSQAYFTSGSLGRYGPTNTLQNFYAPLYLPLGAVVEYVGLNSLTDTPGGLGVAIYRRTPNGALNPYAEFSSTVHANWATDYNTSPINLQLTVADYGTIVHVQQGSLPTAQFFGHVEVWWRWRVSPAFVQTFNDVPPDHPFFEFIEALAASGITAGCGDGTNFCPGNPLTRGQMAVFLAKALGLHYGAATPPQLRAPEGSRD